MPVYKVYFSYRNSKRKIREIVIVNKMDENIAYRESLTFLEQKFNRD